MREQRTATKTSHCKYCNWTGDPGPVAICPRCAHRWLHTIEVSEATEWQQTLIEPDPCRECKEVQLHREGNDVECLACGAFYTVESDPDDDERCEDDGVDWYFEQQLEARA